jgi:hypothetical protein
MCLRETCSEEEIARKYATNYVWSRKAYVSTMGHERHEEARKLLEETCQVTKEVFGDLSIQSMHASFLLQGFHS